MHLVMACVGCSFDSFSVFLLRLKQENFRKITFYILQYGHIPPQIIGGGGGGGGYFVPVNCMG